MSEPAAIAAATVSAARVSEHELARRVRALEDVPMLAGLSREDLRELASALRPVELAPGEVLWEQATPSEGLHILLTGELRMWRRLPGEREFEVARTGPGRVVGGILLLGGGLHAAAGRAAQPCSLLFLHRDDFHARLQLAHRSIMVLKQRIVEDTCARVRGDHAMIAAAIGTTQDPVPARRASTRQLPCERSAPAPSYAYAARLPFFAGMEVEQIAALLAEGETLRVDPGCVLISEGEITERCFVVLSGAVEDVVRRGDRVVRTRFAGPGRACAYLGYLDGKPASVTTVARERTIAFAISAEDFRERMSARDDLSRAFAVAVVGDLMATLASTSSPKAYLAAAESP